MFSAAADAPEVWGSAVKVKAAVAIDPAPAVSAGKIKIPTFFGCGQNDTVVPCWSVKAMYEVAPATGAFSCCLSIGCLFLLLARSAT